MKDAMQAYVLEGSPDAVSGSVKSLETSRLPDGDVTIRVRCSDINYKDAMAAAGVGKMVRAFPHVPGIDLAGEVEADRTGRFKPGDKVLVTGYDMGIGWFGGYAQYARVPAAWVVPLPAGLTFTEAMSLGTAGFTAMLALLALERNGVKPEQGPVLVTGATGGVGSIAVDLLASAGYAVVGSSGKADMRDYLLRIGAREVVSREEVVDESPKVLLKERWAAAVDNVGGKTLETVLRSIRIGGSVALTGNVHGNAVATTVLPFILRGVNLLGIDSVNCPMPERLEAWSRLAGKGKPRHLGEIAHPIALAELGPRLKEILGGGARGRYLLNIPG
jgi:putative YhdH/YhfP family quinone oxidoreductase